MVERNGQNDDEALRMVSADLVGQCHPPSTNLIIIINSLIVSSSLRKVSDTLLTSTLCTQDYSAMYLRVPL